MGSVVMVPIWGIRAKTQAIWDWPAAWVLTVTESTARTSKVEKIVLFIFILKSINYNTRIRIL